MTHSSVSLPVCDHAEDAERTLNGARVARELRQSLLHILQTPELTTPPTWYHAISALCQRRSTPTTSSTTQVLATTLAEDATALLRRRDALFDGLVPGNAGGYSLPESKLGAITAEAQAIGGAVQALWQRAKSLAQAG